VGKRAHGPVEKAHEVERQLLEWNMLGQRERRQEELFISGSLESLIPEDHILKRVDRILDLSWLEEEVKGAYCEHNGRPGIAPQAALRLMLAGFFLGLIQDRRLMREAQVNLAIRWFAGYRLDESDCRITAASPAFGSAGEKPSLNAFSNAPCSSVFRRAWSAARRSMSTPP
jgi:hypothetical protein